MREFKVKQLVAPTLIVFFAIGYKLGEKTKEYIDIMPNAGTLTYTKHARPIFQKNCLPCHNLNNPYNLPSWLDYKTAYDKRDKIRYRVWEIRSMPLGQNMPENERKMIKDWIDSGAKE